MVFNSAPSQPEAAPESDPKPDSSMASTAPTNNKSLLHHQPHNLPLPPFTWVRSNNHTSTNTKSNENNDKPSQQPSQNAAKLARPHWAAEQPKPKSSNAEKEAKPVPAAAAAIDGGRETQKAKSKFCIKLRTKDKDPVVEPEPEVRTNDKAPVLEPELQCQTLSSVAALAEALEEEEMVQKTWNLRPRRQVLKPNGHAGAMKTGAPLAQHNKPQAAGAGGSSKAGGAKGAQKKDNSKLKISLSLTKEEIEEDLFIMTGARPSRRPQKRPKNVQKQLDHLFPGLYLNTVSRDSYEVPEPPIKRI